MAIYTRFGSLVTVTGGNIESGEVNIQYVEDGAVRHTYIKELKADNGIKEIYESIEEISFNRHKGV